MVLADYKLPEFRMLEHSFKVPLDYAKPESTISVFVRELRRYGSKDDSPYLLFLQGGPGGESPRPSELSGWIKRALKDYHVLLIDQRGTGRSTPVTFQTLEPLSASEQADYLSHFRADSIVRDAEFIRKALGSGAWSILGQSFGGFCALHYVSAAPEGLKKVFITGGIPSLDRHIDDVYKETYPIVKEKNAHFFGRYPDAQEQCERVANYLLDNEVFLPNGQRFTVEQFQQLGMRLGGSTGFEQLHYLLEHAFVTVNGNEELSYTFLHDVFKTSSFIRSPLFSILHEAIYCQGFASNWSAERVRQTFEEFNYKKDKPFLFTGEMVYSWMFDEYETLTPLKEAAELLAKKTDWSSLYDKETLAQNSVPIVAAVYFNDMYVPTAFSLETAKYIPKLETWITSEYEHNGLRADGERILDKLISMTQHH